MSPWIWSGQAALIVGGLSFAVLWIPMLVLQYRRWGSWNMARLLGSLAISLYGSALVTYTLLPLPDRATMQCTPGSHSPQLTPLRMAGDIAAVIERRTSWTQALTNTTFLQVAFNVVLFMPWGIIVRRHLRRGFVFTVVTGFLVSLAIESTQGTGLWGIYPCAYRLADVDDLITNTAGAFLGALMAPLVLWWMPDAKTLAERRLDPRPVTATRRWTGQLIDLALYLLLSTFLHVVTSIPLLLLRWGPDETRTLAIRTAVEVVVWLLVFVLPPSRHLGASPGQAAVWLTPMWCDRDGNLNHGRWWRRLARANVVALPYMALSTWAVWYDVPITTVIWAPLVVLSVVLVPFTLTHRSLSGWLTRARFVDIRTLHDDEAVRRDRGGFRQPSQTSSATSNVNGSVATANPTP